MLRRLEKLQFVIGIIDKASSPIMRLQARLHALGVEHMKMYRQGFHEYGASALEASTKVGLITTALVAATAAAGALAKGLGVLGGGLTEAVAGAAPLVGAGAVGAMGAMNASGVSRDLTSLNTTTDISKETLQTYRYASRSIGMEAGLGEFGDISEVFSEVTEKIDELNEKGYKAEAYETLRKLKIPFRELRAMDADELLNRVAIRMDELGMSGKDKIELLDELVDDGSKLLPIIGKNAVVMQRFQDQAQATGGFITEEQTRLMRVSNTEVALLKTGLEGYGNVASEFAGRFMELYGPNMNQFLANNADGFRAWIDAQIVEIERLHKVMEKGGMGAVLEDLSPKLHAVFRAIGAFFKKMGQFFGGMNDSFFSPFMQQVKSTWDKTYQYLAASSSGARVAGYSFGAILLPIFIEVTRAWGDALIFINQNWEQIKAIFNWSPLGLIKNNWEALLLFFAPITKSISDLATHFGLLAPGINAAGAPMGSVLGLLVSLLAIILLNKIAFGAFYAIVRLFNAVWFVFKSLTMLVTLATWLFRASIIAARLAMIMYRLAIVATIISSIALQAAWLVLRQIVLLNIIALAAWRVALIAVNAVMIVMRSVGLVGFLIVMAAQIALLTVKTVIWRTATLAAYAAMVLLRGLNIASLLIALAASMSVAAIASGVMAVATTAASFAVGALTTALAILFSPIGLVIAAIAAVIAAVIALYYNWNKVTQYLQQTEWGQAVLAVFDAITHPVRTFNQLANWLHQKWQQLLGALQNTGWGSQLIAVFSALMSPIDLLKAGAQSLKNYWDSTVSSLSNTSWGQAISGTIQNLLGFIDKFKEGWAFVKNAASQKISGAWSGVKSFVGLSDDSSQAPSATSTPVDGGARALGGPVMPGHFYQVNEHGPEILQTGGQSYLMTGGIQGNIVPFPTLFRNQNNTAANITERIAGFDNTSNTTLDTTDNVINLTERYAQKTNNNNAIGQGHISNTVTQLDKLGSTSSEKVFSEKLTAISINDKQSDSQNIDDTTHIPTIRPQMPSSGHLRQQITNMGKGTSNNRTIQSGRTISIGQLTIVVQGDLDTEQFMHELEMVA